MNLNTLKPAEGSKSDRRRVGRGIGCGWGKTCAKINIKKKKSQLK